VGRRWLAPLLLLMLWSTPAGAAGGRLAPVRDRYEPGDDAILVGYTGGRVPVDTFSAYLRVAGTVPRSRLVDSDRYVGELHVDDTGRPGYQRLRVTLTFAVPVDVEPGQYEVVYCDDPCTGAPLGDLVTSPLSIGVDPVRPVVREWPLDEPEVANLDGRTVLVAPGVHTTAAELRAPAPATTVAPPPPPPPPPITAPAATAAEPPTRPSDDTDWSLPTALVLGSAAGTALLLAAAAGGPGAVRRRSAAAHGHSRGAPAADPG
jgi:hypothetical protein